MILILRKVFIAWPNIFKYTRQQSNKVSASEWISTPEEKGGGNMYTQNTNMISLYLKTFFPSNVMITYDVLINEWLISRFFAKHRNRFIQFVYEPSL